MWRECGLIAQHEEIENSGVPHNNIGLQFKSEAGPKGRLHHRIHRLDWNTPKNTEKGLVRGTPGVSSTMSCTSTTSKKKSVAVRSGLYPGIGKQTLRADPARG